MLAQGPEEVAAYLRQEPGNSTAEYIGEMSPEDVFSVVQKELDSGESIPAAVKPIAGAECLVPPAEDESDGTIYAQLFLGDVGPGGGIAEVNAQSPKYGLRGEA